MKSEILEKNYYYHIYNKGINGTNIFSNNENKSYFLKQLDNYLKGNLSVYAYCLMDNHFHLIVKVNSDPEIVTQSFSNFFNAYAKAYNKEVSRTGSLFEKHFKRIRLDNELYLKNLILYIHLNPKHHLNIDFKSFLFSSYRSILSDKETKLERSEILDLFGGRENFIFCHTTENELLTEKYTFE
ncbi:hypothetical protein [Flavobacterium sp. PL12]|uniref:hypothetical protein n=1 Tax=Flavobacterium sp. PL12 TaxID=3071718 RepID=UPI00319DF777